MPNLLIVRGLPGSGKSTFAKSILDNSNDCALVTKSFNNMVYTHHYEADMFFENNGVYNLQKKRGTIRAIRIIFLMRMIGVILM